MHSRTLRRGAGAGCVSLALTAVSACTGSGAHPAAPRPSNQPAHVKPVVAEVVAGTVHRVTARSLGKSWHPGCPLRPSELRAVNVAYWGFDHQRHVGTIVVNRRAAHEIVVAFAAMARRHFPIRRVVPIAAYGGSDNRSMRHDNTSAFNCRYAVATGPKHWSDHAFGYAVDLDPRENPYRLAGRILPPSGKAYANRADVRRGMITSRGAAVRSFEQIGWGWGGRWSSTPDYQHFSVDGR